MKRTVFYVSESTGITAETLGHSLLSQFEGIDFEKVYMPYINTPERARELVQRFDDITRRDGARPIVLGTMLDGDIRETLSQGSCCYIELYETFIEPLAAELGRPPSRKTGQSHGLVNSRTYDRRMGSINFAMANDDGMNLKSFGRADVILIGVSRSGKTPTCLYLAMHFGLLAANYPLTEEDFTKGKIPDQLYDQRHKIFGLTIDPYRLHRIREERRSDSDYASRKRCQTEVRQAEVIFKHLGIHIINTTSHSIEEIASQIMKLL